MFNEDEDNYSPVYYKIMLNNKNKYVVVRLQDSDEWDYNQSKFLKDKDGEAYRFLKRDNGEEEAKKFLNKVIKPEFIHKEDLIPNNEHMYKIPLEEW